MYHLPLDLKVTKDTRLILNIIYVWKLNQTVLELDFWAVNFLFFPRRDLNSHHWQLFLYIYIYIKYICTIYTRLDTCLMYISRFSLQDKVALRSLKLHFLWSGCGRVVFNIIIWQQSNSAIFNIFYRIMKNSLYSHMK
jgi:hypothetical protein